jgi:hypothetical protein
MSVGILMTMSLGMSFVFFWNGGCFGSARFQVESISRLLEFSRGQLERRDLVHVQSDARKSFLMWMLGVLTLGNSNHIMVPLTSTTVYYQSVPQ